MRSLTGQCLAITANASKKCVFILYVHIFGAI